MGGMPSIDGGVGIGDEVKGTFTDGDITLPIVPIELGDGAAIIDDTDGGPIWAGDGIFIDAGDMAIGVPAGVCTDGDMPPNGLGDG